MPTLQPKILILDDDVLMLETLSATLSANAFAEVHTVETPAQARHFFRTNKVDILVSDIRLARNENGIEVVKELREGFDFLLVFISGSHYTIFEETLATNPDANLIKPFSDQQALTTLKQVWNKKLQSMPSAQDIPELSERERAILGMLAKGQTTREVADRLSISIHTVQFHRKSMLKKMEAHSIQELLSKAGTLGIL